MYGVMGTLKSDLHIQYTSQPYDIKGQRAPSFTGQYMLFSYSILWGFHTDLHTCTFSLYVH